MKRVLVLLGTLAVALGVSSTAVHLYGQAKAKADGKAEIEALENRYIQAFKAKDVNAIMSNYAPGDNLFVFDAVPPREYRGWDAYKKDWEQLFAAYPGPIDVAMSELSITVAGSMAYGYNIQSGYFTRKDGSRLDIAVRVTDVYRKLNGKWLIVHEHVSVPVDLDSGKADLLSKP